MPYVLLERGLFFCVTSVAQIFAGLLIFLPVFVLPQFLVAFGLFFALARAMGWPIVRFVVGGLILQVLLAFDPLLLRVLAVYAIIKTCVYKKPLVDLDYWRNKYGCSGEGRGGTRRR